MVYLFMAYMVYIYIYMRYIYIEMCVYIYIYIYIYTVFNPVNLELGTIPSRTIKTIKIRILNLSNPGQELNANKIHRANYFFRKKKKPTVSHIKIIN